MDEDRLPRVPTAADHVRGTSEEEAIGQFDQSSLAGFIQKPYLPNTLTAKVCEAIAIQ